MNVGRCRPQMWGFYVGMWKKRKRLKHYTCASLRSLQCRCGHEGHEGGKRLLTLCPRNLACLGKLFVRCKERAVRGTVKWG